MEEARDIVFKNRRAYNHENLQVSIIYDRNVGNKSELQINTTFIAKNLLVKHKHPSQKPPNKVGADYIINVIFGNNNYQNIDKQAGLYYIDYLNVIIYTECLHKSTYIPKWRIDFVQHWGSIDNTDPNTMAICFAQAPMRETIANKIQAINNFTNSNLFITEKHLTKIMKELKDKLYDKFDILTITINTHMDQRLKTTTATITRPTTNLQIFFGMIAHEFQVIEHPHAKDSQWSRV